MRIPRIYQAIELLPELEFQLSDSARQHIIQVLRLDSGAKIRVFCQTPCETE